MKTVIVTGSAGLVGSSAVRKFAGLGYFVVGIDNWMREKFFGNQGYSNGTADQRLDIRSEEVAGLMGSLQEDGDVAAIVHCAAQPSHDWAAQEPHTDFGINAVGTLNLLEATRRHCPQAAFIFMSTNKVYGDWPNLFEYYHDEHRLHPRGSPHPVYDCGWRGAFCDGFNETLSVDHCTHSLFGASKLAADILVQEYGRYFGMNTVCFRAGCITGPAHAGVPQHGFLAYIVKCAMTGTPYEIIGYGGKQVRDNIHADDLASAFVEYLNAPTPGAVYNIGGGPERSCSVLEAIAMVERISGRKMQTSYVDEPRKGDHKWWISDCRKFQRQYPEWRQEYTLERTIEEIVHAHAKTEAA